MVSSATKVAKTATEALKVLWADEFFDSWKGKDAVEEALAKRGNHFNDAELGMALMRANFLTRRGKRGHFEYIQKYRFVLEGGAEAEGKRGN